MQQPTYRNILKALSLFTGVQGLSILLNVVRGKLAAVLLGPAGIGLNSIFNELRELIHETTNLGLDKSGVREVARAYAEKDDPKDEAAGEQRVRDAIMLTRSWVLLLALVGTCLTALLALPLSQAFFSDYGHVWDFVLLAPAVGLSTISCGELIVLRGIRRLKRLALVSVLHVVAGILSTIPIYYVWGMAGVVPALVLLALSMALISVGFSYRLYRPRFCFERLFLSKGKTMLVIGLSFVLSGVVSHLSKLFVQGYLNRETSLDMVGYYAQILSLATYCCIIFASVDTDYFPRLSGIFDDVKARTESVSRQIRMTLCVALPVMMAILFALPILIPLLMSNAFCAILPASQMVVASLLLKAVYLPTSYMPLSAGDSKTFLFMQSVSYVCFVPAVLVGYQLFGLLGIGLGVVASNVFDVASSLLCAKVRYQFLLDWKTTSRLLFYAALMAAAYIVVCKTEGWAYWTLGGGMVLIACMLSVGDMRKMLKQDAEH